MPAPAPIPPLSGPGPYPGEIPVLVEQGGSGGGSAGRVVRGISEGVNVAFGANPTTEDPQFHNIGGAP